MERLTLTTGRRGPSNDCDTGQNANAHGGRGRRQRSAQKDQARGREGRRRTEETDGGGAEGLNWRGRGRVELGRGEERGAGKEKDRGGGKGLRGRGRGRGGGEGLRGRGRGGGGGGAADGRRGDERVVGRGGGQSGGGGRRGGNGWHSVDRQMGRSGRNGEPDTPERKRAGREFAEMGVRRGGHSVDRRGSRGGERKDNEGDRQEHDEWRLYSTGRVRTPQGCGLGYKTLDELSGKEPSVVAITLSSNQALQGVLSDTKMRQDLVELLCLVMSKAFKSYTSRATLQHLAGIIKDSGFFRTVLPHYLVGMVSEFNPVRRAQYPQQLENILAILSQVLNIFPASSVQAVSLLLTLLQASINNLRTSGVEIQPQMEETVENLQGLIQHLQERSRDGTLRSDRDTYALLPNEDNNPGEEHQDFRDLPIYPTPEEFQQDHRPFLRPNLTSQRYTNTHLYLDTHFRLLREDFVRPLREGIQQLLQNQMAQGRSDKPLRTKRFDDIHIYFDARLVVPKCTQTGVAYVVQFDIEPLKFVRWQNSKRLLYGSLVCLSCDNFESFLFATVSDRDPKNLEHGQVQITFTEESRLKLARIEKDQVFLMVETTAYFEAYRYVLEGLQKQEEDSLPFQRYIVECSTDVLPPAYLQRKDIYDLSSVANPDCKDSILPFHSMEAGTWPSMEKLGLDESQMKAFQLAITKELAIIQGPPGTGKTYVGLKIAQALLTNQNLWRDENGMAPMLVVCYTNHALDQFLEGIHTFLRDGIVRVGGRSNSEILKRFNLRELAHSRDLRYRPPSHLRTAYNEIYKLLCQEERTINRQSVMLACSLKGVLRESFLERFISDRHWNSLHCPPVPPMEDDFSCSQKPPSLIMEWLGLGCTVFQQRGTENANINGDVAPEDMMEVDEEDLIEIEEEADLIQAERIIEGDTGRRDGRDGGKKGDMEEAVHAMEELMLAMNLDNAQKQVEQSEDGFQMQPKQRKKMKNKIRNELGKSSAMTKEEEDNVCDVWMLGLPDRWRLYRLWVARYTVELRTKVIESEQDYQNIADRLVDVKQQQDLCILKKATVIGMTTTGAAKFRTVLQEVRPRVVIVEEAAEVLEAHTITTLSQACQHLILIGDHQQLRPSATVYDLAKNFNLEMSMFERLVKMGHPFVRLNYQHRMRPEIARLLTPHIYSELENHPSVLDYDNIKGLKTNLFFVEHSYQEQEIKDGKSHRNQHEAMFVVELCRYLLLQDYKPEQITILTTYTGQLHCLRNLMPASHFSGVKVHVVDKYQGEENDIVLLSLVRSNKQDKVGFLNIPNRVCVALSRAKKGLYCIGNSTMLGQVKLWSNIFHTLREAAQIGKALTLCCQNHPKQEIKASCAEDFKQAPEGGCNQPCQFRLDCGHVCARACHPYDPEHKKYKCTKKCEKILCDLGHRCTFVCHKKCPEKCSVKIEKIIPQCEHIQMVPCHQDPSTFVCKEPCQKMLRCGHLCDSLCGEPCTTQCKVKVTLNLKCGHSQAGACFYKTQTVGPECKTPCEHQLKCGHACRGSCGKCYQGRFHFPCLHQCERLLICSHKCMEPCTRDCPPCNRPCENCCVHSNCMKPCGQPCAPCIEPCAWQCPHQRCTKLCHEPCDRPPCTQPCAKTLDCGHPCIGLCGDKCPSKCRVCNHKEVTEILFGTEDEPDAYFIELEDCGHIIEYTAMDQYMGMDDSQQVNEEVAIKLKECPRCRTPLRKNLRYGAHINRSLAEIEMVKEKINGHQVDIEEHKKALKKRMEENPFCDMPLQKTYMQIEHRLEKRFLTANDLWILENKMDFLIRIAKLLEIEEEQKLFTRLRKNVTEFVDWLSDHRLKFTDQQVYDLQRELQRLTLLANLNARCHMANKRGQGDKIQSEVQKLRDVLETFGQFTEQDEQTVKEGMKELDDKFPGLKGLGINEEERQMIVSAMKMPPGHWHKCPNGHVYLITECGGAMESRRCPDCDATIGGGNHTLASGNQVASEMDGAQHPAWSEAYNLANFNRLDF